FTRQCTVWHTLVVHQRGIAQRNMAAFDRATYADAARRLEALGGDEGKPAAPGLVDDRMRQRMLGSLIEARGNPQHFRLVPPGSSDDTIERGLAFGQRAGLVDDDGVDRAEGLDR